LNIHNTRIPFGGVIEHTNFIPPGFYGGRHIIYVFNYLDGDDPFFRADEETVRETYFSGLAKIFPHFSRRRVETAVLSRSLYATPVYGGDYTMRRPTHRTPLPNLFLANTAQVYPQDRNVSNCIANAQALCTLIGSGDAKLSDGQPT
jgi:protoporphyrinogen oxidase